MSEFNMPEGAHDEQHETGQIEDQPETPVLICPACGGKGTYLGQLFHGVQPCPKCAGDGYDKTIVSIAGMSDKDLLPVTLAETRARLLRAKDELDAARGTVTELRGLLLEVTGVLMARFTGLFLDTPWTDPPTAVDVMADEIFKLREDLRVLKLSDRVVTDRPDGVERITRERHRQVSAEGWTSQHDAGHVNGEICRAAVAYAEVAIGQVVYETITPPYKWPWEYSWWKPSEDPVRNLEKAGALIAAEIDRLLAIKESQCQVAVDTATSDGGENA